MKGLLLGLMFSCCLCLPAQAEKVDTNIGLSLLFTRVIFHESDEKGVSLQVNNKTDNAYLLQSVIHSVDPNTGLVMEAESLSEDSTLSDKKPFMVTPPLFRFEPKSEIKLLIRRVPSVLLDDKKESVFYISLKAIPIIHSEMNQNNMSISTVINLKLFYRPNALEKWFIEEVPDSEKLTFSIKQGAVEIINPTPYWITFDHLTIEGLNIDKESLRRMLPPLGTVRYVSPALSKNKSEYSIEWSLLDELGGSTKITQQVIH
ncbi:TPA: molecular chaperone [Escherichia coli]|uniref:Periplasmic fimbrial chaperone n=2 Tax=Proteus hauseri TaxID=183417 RepID=A0AAJ3HVG3_PROHU|nr:periplasmic fimbrial chaperone [Proteus hauseri ATCC 700826]HDH9217590.1 molecular chaperone [Escherichia coli]